MGKTAKKRAKSFGKEEGGQNRQILKIVGGMKRLDRVLREVFKKRKPR